MVAAENEERLRETKNFQFQRWKKFENCLPSLSVSKYGPLRPHQRNKKECKKENSILKNLSLVFYLFATGVAGEREDRQFSLFNVIKFPNDLCLGSGSLNGTCYTATECTSLGGTSSGTCASGFGVCCVFSLACGGSTSANTSYAIINSFNTATDTDPCIYKFCKNNDDVCKLR